MGRTPKPLRFLVTDEDLYELPEMVKLREQGHPMQLVEEGETVDVYIGRRCWYMDQPHIRKYLDVAIKAARERVYPKKEVAKE